METSPLLKTEIYYARVKKPLLQVKSYSESYSDVVQDVVQNKRITYYLHIMLQTAFLVLTQSR